MVDLTLFLIDAKSRTLFHDMFSRFLKICSHKKSLPEQVLVVLRKASDVKVRVGLNSQGNLWRQSRFAPIGIISISAATSLMSLCLHDVFCSAYHGLSALHCLGDCSSGCERSLKGMSGCW